MSFRAVRQSKFRHVFGKEEKRDAGYDGIKISRNAWDSPFCDVNNKFLAVVLEAQGGGAFLVLPLEKTGRVDLNAPRVCGHTAAVLDVKWCPYNDNMIASCSEDCLIKVWEVPDGGLTEPLRESLVDLEGHQRRVGIIEWHPTAENILLSAGFDYMIFIWDLGSATIVKEISCHSDTIYSVSWNFIGSHIATTSKDKKIRYIDARSGEVLQEGKGHEGTKASRVVFVGDDDKMFTTGFSRMSERQYAVWDKSDLSRPKKLEMIDQGSGVLFPTYDPDTRMVYVGGKGDGNIRYFEITDDSGLVYFLSDYKTSAPQRGLGWLPKTGVNVNNCEIARCFKLHPKGFVEVISFTVPRKSTLFQDDIFPPTKEPVPSMTADEWVGGANTPCKKISMKDGFVSEKRTVKSGGLNKGLNKGLNAAKPTAAKPVDDVPKGEAALLKAYHDHVAEIKSLKEKIAALEAQ
eukprot:m.319221 g.319221  ORF g.319221 m.319221 type:complete len:461 (+) comp20300_c0_seq2:59-1441(+)